LEQEIYLFRGYRNFIVETDAKYLMGMLNNPEKMPNATINRWVDYIQTHFFFKIVHKKGKTFGPDSLSRRKWYPGDPQEKDLSQLCYGPVVTYCMVYHYTKRATLARLLANEGPAIYVVHLNRYFVIPP